MTKFKNVTKTGGGGSNDRADQQNHHTSWVAGFMVYALIQIIWGHATQKQQNNHIRSLRGLPLLWKAMTSKWMRLSCDIRYATWILACTHVLLLFHG